VPELNITVRGLGEPAWFLAIVGEVKAERAEPRRPGEADRFHAGKELPEERQVTISSRSSRARRYQSMGSVKESGMHDLIAAKVF